LNLGNKLATIQLTHETALNNLQEDAELEINSTKSEIERVLEENRKLLVFFNAFFIKKIILIFYFYFSYFCSLERERTDYYTS
jgi:hypothetical protein